MIPRRSLAELQEAVDRLHKPPVKCPVPSLRERCEERACGAFRLGVQASGLSQRAVARRLGVCERFVRDWLHGARPVPTWAGLGLPLEGQVAFIRALTASVVEDDVEGAQVA